MNRVFILILFLLSTVLWSCEGVLTTPDEFAEDFTDFIDNQDYTMAFFMFSDAKRASIDTSDIMSIFDFSSQFEDDKIGKALLQCENLMLTLKDSADYSCRKLVQSSGNGNYAMVVNTYDPEALIKKTIKSLESELSLIEILRYSRMSEDEKMKVLDEKVLEYIQTHPDLPRKDIEIPFNVRHNGVRYVIE